MVNNSPLISIALCTFNGAKFLKEQLDSLIFQSYLNLEIVIVDDCSTDNTVNILRSYELRFNNISVYINESNIGINKSFSKAIGLCHGEFIAISDQDDIWFPNKLETALEFIDNDTMMIYSNSLLIDEAANNLNRLMFGKKKLYSGDDPRSLSLYNKIAGHTMMFRAELREKILPIPCHSHYDWWIGFVAANSGNIVSLDSPFVMHRVHSDSASGKLSLIPQDRFKAMERWAMTMLSVPNLKYKSFFDELYLISKSNNRRTRKFKLLLFQIKYSRFIFTNNSLFYRLKSARKLNFPHIPI